MPINLTDAELAALIQACEVMERGWIGSAETWPEAGRAAHRELLIEQTRREVA